MLPASNPWRTSLIRSTGTVVSIIDENDKIYLAKSDENATEAQQEWSSFRWLIGIDMAVFVREWRRLTHGHVSANGSLSPESIYKQFKISVTSQNQKCPADGDQYFDDVFDKWLGRVERRKTKITTADLNKLYSDVKTSYRRQVRSGKISRASHHVFSTTPFQSDAGAYIPTSPAYFSLPGELPSSSSRASSSSNTNASGTDRPNSGKRKGFSPDTSAIDGSKPAKSQASDSDHDTLNGHGISRRAWRRMSVTDRDLCFTKLLVEAKVAGIDPKKELLSQWSGGGFGRSHHSVPVPGAQNHRLSEPQQGQSDHG